MLEVRKPEEKDLADLLYLLLKFREEFADTFPQANIRKVAIEIDNHFKNGFITNAYKELGSKVGLGGLIDMVTAFQEAGAKEGGGMVQALMGIGLVITGIIKLFNAIAKQTDQVGQSFGSIGVNEFGHDLKMANVSAQALGYNFEEMAGSVNELANNWGISFDNAILEKVENLSMLKLNLIWEDLGTWQSLTNLSTNNKVSLEDDAFIYNNSCNTSVISDRRNTIVNDISDAIVVSYKESLYISSKKNSNKIKEILSEKKNKSISEYQSLFYKPWGHYEIFSRSKNYLLKKISIKPYCRLSLQKHQYRSEHWVVVKGKAKVTMGSKENILKENQSTFIPIGLKHCIENIGKDYLEIIEVQMGSILSEDDIIRLDDPYKR